MAKVEVRPSPIHGLGVFATEPIQGGERIRSVNVVREITAESPLREDLGESIDHCSYPDGKVVLWGLPDRHVNHSCDPNAWVSYQDGGCHLVARRQVASGDEITCDYNINIADGTSWPCRCGAARCSGRVAGDFFLLPTRWQREYRRLLAPWFVRRHRRRLAALDRGPIMLDQILASYEWYDHPEGVKFVETHRDAYRTSGHWLITAGVFSTFHKWVGGEELWLIHLGSLALHLIEPSGGHRLLRLGTNVGAGERPVAAVPASCWQAAELPDGVEFAFGTVVCAPPFSFEQLVTAQTAQLEREFPQHRALIRRLTR